MREENRTWNYQVKHLSKTLNSVYNYPPQNITAYTPVHFHALDLHTVGQLFVFLIQ